MSDGRNKHGVKQGQVWLDNDIRISQGRRFEVMEVDLDYYPHGRALCRLIGQLKHGQRPTFYARLDRFNGNQRGYSLVASSLAAAKKAKKKAKVQKATKKAKKAARQNRKKKAKKRAKKKR
jgi:hypothetical protein